MNKEKILGLPIHYDKVNQVWRAYINVNKPTMIYIGKDKSQAEKMIHAWHDKNGVKVQAANHTTVANETELLLRRDIAELQKAIKEADSAAEDSKMQAQVKPVLPDNDDDLMVLGFKLRKSGGVGRKQSWKTAKTIKAVLVDVYIGPVLDRHGREMRMEDVRKCAALKIKEKCDKLGIETKKETRDGN